MPFYVMNESIDIQEVAKMKKISLIGLSVLMMWICVACGGASKSDEAAKEYITQNLPLLKFTNSTSQIASLKRARMKQALQLTTPTMLSI